MRDEMASRIRALAVTLILLALPLSAAAQPAWLPGDTTWAEPSSPITIYVQADGDSAWVYPVESGHYGRAQENDGGWRYHCPTQADSASYSLSTTLSNVEGLKDLVNGLIEDGEMWALPPGILDRASCVNSFRLHVDTLLSTNAPGREKSVTYATQCVTSVDNATVHVPAEANWWGVRPPEVGDTLAVYSESGTCVGQGAWTKEGATLAAAEGYDYGGGASQDGLQPGDPIRLVLYLRDAEREYPVTATWADCETVGMAMCSDTTYATDSYMQLADADFEQ